MYLGNPLLPVNITAISVEETIKNKLLEKNWHEYELKPLRLNLVPYFLFNYHYFVEADTGAHRIVKSAVDGILAVDGHTVEVREDLVELIKNNWKKSTAEIPRGQFDEKWCNIEKKEQEEVLKVKTAKHFEVPKNNVVISSARKLFMPLYKTVAIIDEKEYPLIINAIDGSIQGIEVIPEREKGYFEITRETINELKRPSAWIKYSKEALAEGSSELLTKRAPRVKKSAEAKESKKATRGKSVLSFLESKKMLLIIIILAAILLLAAIFRM